MSAFGRVVRAVGERGASVERRLYAMRRTAVLLRARTHAAWQRASIDLNVDRDVRFGRGVQIWVEPGTRTVLHIGPGVRIDDNVRILLYGGETRIGGGSLIRRFTTLNVAGRLTLEGDNLLSWGCVVHCAGLVSIGRHTIVGEYSTIVDSAHFFTNPDDPVWQNSKAGEVHIGYNTWVAAKATIARGANVGNHCIIGAHAVVTGAIADGQLVAPPPSTAVAAIRLPWVAARQPGDLPPSTRS
jgi:acetyltransferase-like isoleucine patch superfamily enzyme